MNSIYFTKNALLIRRSLVRAQVGEPITQSVRLIAGAFSFVDLVQFSRRSLCFRAYRVLVRSRSLSHLKYRGG